MKKHSINLIDVEKVDVSELTALIGKKITNVGFCPGIEGGLTLEYQDGHKIKRMILGFTELGMWVDWHGIKGATDPENILLDKIEQLYQLAEMDFSSGLMGDTFPIPFPKYCTLERISGNICKLNYNGCSNYEFDINVKLLPKDIQIMFEKEDNDVIIMKILLWAESKLF